jgi:hypothetical protein
VDKSGMTAMGNLVDPEAEAALQRAIQKAEK